MEKISWSDAVAKNMSMSDVMRYYEPDITDELIEIWYCKADESWNLKCRMSNIVDEIYYTYGEIKELIQKKTQK